MRRNEQSWLGDIKCRDADGADVDGDGVCELSDSGDAAEQLQWLGWDERDRGEHSVDGDRAGTDGSGWQYGQPPVQIVNASGQVLSGGSATVSTAAGSAGSFLYANLTSPVTLNANTTYYIVSQETSGGDQWYDINTTIQTANVASETTGVWSPDGVTYNLYGSPDESYGPLSFLYATATVSTAPMITQQPQNATIAVNGTATFTVGASGGNLTYQWWSEAPAGTSFTQISGATGSSYTTPAEGLAASGTQYECVVTNNLGSATSNAVTLTVQTSTATAYVSSQTLGTLRNNFSGWVGMSVTVGNTPLTVTALGRMEVAGNTGRAKGAGS